MKSVITYVSFILMIFIASCGVNQSEYDRLKKENEKLKEELEEFKSGAERLIAQVEKSYNENNYSEAKHNIELLFTKHPESPKNAEFKVLLKEIEKKEIQEKRIKDTEEKERIKLENQNNLGIWTVSHYVDDFGDPMKLSYIRNEKYIAGTFSNTATHNSELNVKLLINSSTDISIMLYEYAGNNPVKSNLTDSYTIKVKDRDGNKIKLRANNYSDRLCLGKADSKVLHNILLKGGEVQFWIQDIETPTTQYQFDISNTDWYGNAYSRLMNK